MGRLKDSMKEYMEIRGYAAHTVESYINCVNIYSHYYNICPLYLSSKDIESFLLHLREIKKSDNTIYMYYSAIKLFYKINNLEYVVPNISFVRTKVKLPYVISQKKVLEIIERCSSLKFKTMLSLLYSSGMRISELINLSIKDIDFERKLVFIRNSKHKKDRYTIIGERTIILLKRYIELYQPYTYLFYDSADRCGNICADSIRKEFKKLIKISGLDPKKATLHTLRHCFATHLLEKGTNLFHIMHLLGHSQIQTTMVYLHLDENQFSSIISPIDSLEIPMIVTKKPEQMDLFPLSA